MVESDVDDTPVTLRVRCKTCGKIEMDHTVREALSDYTDNGDGTYSSPYGECAQCLTGED